MPEDVAEVTLSTLDALSVALGEVITNPSLCSSALGERRKLSLEAVLEIITEVKCALDVFAGEKSISTLF